MAVALARARADAKPARAATAEAAPVVQRASSDSRRYALAGNIIQPALRISAAHDPAEREAESVAARVARGGIGRSAPGLQRSPLLVQRRTPGAGAGGGTASPLIESRVRAAATGGSPLVPALRQTVEPRFRADFGGVRLHTDAKAAALATAIGARAFTFGNHIFFNTGQYDPHSPDGLELLAHELTHTIQQSAVIQRAAADAPAISERTPPEASRLGISDALDFFADAANAIPGYRMFTILIGVNPINMNAVEASAANILRAIVEFLPGGFIITRVLDSYGIFDRVGGWIEGQLKSLGITGAAIRAAVNRFLDSLSWRDIFALGSLWDRAKAIFTTPITRIIAFARSLFGEVLRFVREAVLRPLAALAEGTAGYGLLKAVIGFDPVSGQAVPRTADTIIGGFMAMIGQQELWENIKRANATSRAWAWFQGALGGLMGLVRSIPDRFMTALRGLEIMDFVVLPSAFVKLARVFGGFLGDFGRWALSTVLDLLRIVVEVVAPGVMPYLRRAAGAFNTIISNPVRFVQTLVRAALAGFRSFAGNFLNHLRASLIGWLTGSMAGTGVYIPQGFNLREILKFGLSVLGLTWANIRAKLVRATNENVVVALETGFDIVRTLVTEGPAAAWAKILETLTNLRDMVIEQVMAFVQSRIVQAAISRLLSMLSPAGALIQAIIAIYNTIMFFVERLRQIAQVAASFIDGLASIAAGNINGAAARVEATMAGLLTLVISFLARIAGLGRVSDAVRNVIDRIRAPIDRALDRVVTWIVEQARRLGRFVATGVRRGVAAVRSLVRDRTIRGDRGSHRMFVAPVNGRPVLKMQSVEMTAGAFLRLAEADSAIPATQKTRIPEAHGHVATIDTAVFHLESEVLPVRQERFLTVITRSQVTLSEILQQILRNVPITNFDARYTLEGMVGTYGSLEGLQSQDRMTPDHQPQAAVLQYAATLPAFAGPEGAVLRAAAGGRHADGATAINLHEVRHRLGRTFGTRGRGTATAARGLINAAVAAHPGDLSRQRRAIIAILRSELVDDVIAMRAVYAQPLSGGAWVDLRALVTASTLTTAQATVLRDRIHDQVDRGHSRMVGQPLNRYGG